MSGATLCAQLYKASACARQVLQDQGGLKSFISIPLLEKDVQFAPNKVRCGWLLVIAKDVRCERSRRGGGGLMRCRD